MGIPRLTQDLSGYTEVAVLGDLPSANDGHIQISRVIIDGPSLVYHVYYGLLKAATPAENASAVLPIYSDVVGGVKSCLNALKSQGVSIEAIYFDGSLPVSKRHTRLERMEDMRKQLEGFRKLHPQLSSGNDVNVRAGTSRDTPNRPVSNARHALPPLPFLVPAVLDAAKFSADIPNVSVVPEEADAACARLAKTSGTAILTNDSDLALYDLGPKGCVLFLRTLTSTEVNISQTRKPRDPHNPSTAGSEQRLIVSCIRPAQIAQRLSLSSLLSLGFERSLDSSVSTSGVVQSAKESSTDEEKRHKFDEFRKQFQIPESTPFCRPFDGLDPRISEFITQAQASSDSPHVYLPILHEDPSRYSSWAYGLVYRQLAYSIYYSSFGKTGSGVVEYARKGSRIAPSSVPLLDDVAIAALVEGMLKDLAAVAERLHIEGLPRRLESAPDWYAAALCTVLRWKLANGKALLSHNAIDRLFGVDINERPEPKLIPTWEDMHLLANAQAVLCSWRMLNRIIQWTIHNPSIGAGSKLKVFSQDLGTLKTWQETMPAISELFLDLRQLRTVEASEGRKNASEAVKRLRDEQVGGSAQTHAMDQENDVGDENRKRRKKSKPVPQPKRTVLLTGSNAFGILADDMTDGEEEDDDDDR